MRVHYHGMMRMCASHELMELMHHLHRLLQRTPQRTPFCPNAKGLNVCADRPDGFTKALLGGQGSLDQSKCDPVTRNT